MSVGLETRGLVDLVRVLKGRDMRDVNFALREHAGSIAAEGLPAVQTAVRRSQAPQADAMAATVRVVRDRVPVIAVGKVNPKFRHTFTRRGATRKDGTPRSGRFDVKARRGALAHGVVYGPHGGRRDRPGANYYRIPRDQSGGAVGKALSGGGAVYRRMAEAYLTAYLQVLKAHGLNVFTGKRA